ncbi:MAG: DUF1122 family protein [Candidatus Micrarchaeia archaeon]
MLENALVELKNGINIENSTLYAKKVWKGRLSEETNAALYIKNENEENFVASAKFYYGSKPYNRPWAEIFNISNKPSPSLSSFFGSAFENALLALIARHLEPGGYIFVEYYEDRETQYCLMVGFPAPITRLGYQLFNLGFTWFKDWYFPEGFMEGGQKLQAQTALDNASKERHLLQIKSEVAAFLKTAPQFDKSEYLLRAIERAKKISGEA